MLSSILTKNAPSHIRAPMKNHRRLGYTTDLTIDLFEVGIDEPVTIDPSNLNLNKLDPNCQELKPITLFEAQLSGGYSDAFYLLHFAEKINITPGISKEDDDKIIQALQENISENIINPEIVITILKNAWNEFAEKYHPSSNANSTIAYNENAPYLKWHGNIRQSIKQEVITFEFSVLETQGFYSCALPQPASQELDDAVNTALAQIPLEKLFSTDSVNCLLKVGEAFESGDLDALPSSFPDYTPAKNLYMQERNPFNLTSHSLSFEEEDKERNERREQKSRVRRSI